MGFITILFSLLHLKIITSQYHFEIIFVNLKMIRFFFHEDLFGFFVHIFLLWCMIDFEVGISE